MDGDRMIPARGRYALRFMIDLAETREMRTCRAKILPNVRGFSRNLLKSSQRNWETANEFFATAGELAAAD